MPPREKDRVQRGPFSFILGYEGNLLMSDPLQAATPKHPYLYV